MMWQNGNSRSVLELKVPICCDNCERKVKAALTHVEGEFAEISCLEMSFLAGFLIHSTMLKSDDSGGFLWFLEQISEGFMNIVLVQVWRMFSVTSGAGR